MMTRAQIIQYLKENNVEFNPTLRLADLQELYNKHATPIDSQKNSLENISAQSNSDMSKLLEMMGTVVNKVDALSKRVDKVEGPTGNEFKSGVQLEDVQNADKTKSDIDPRVVKIVEETLGVDFGIELETFTDKPGFLFTVIVPTRLSDIPPSTRPVIDISTGKYKVQEDNKTPILEDYIPEDRRSRAIGSAQSYDAIRDHCNKVRSYLVSYYSKMSKPLPEFKIKI